MKSKRVLISLILGLVPTLGLVFVCTSWAVPPWLVLHPAPNTHTAPSTTTISIVYREPISTATVNRSTFAAHAMETGLLTQTYSVDGGKITLTPPQPLKPGELVQVSATTGTLNITGEHPISYTVWQFRAAVLDSSGVFTDSGQSLGSSDSWALDLGDLDGDGDLDAFVANAGEANKVWLNEMGAFSDSGQALGSSASHGVALGDVDGDGDLDAFVANDSQPNKVWLNDGTGTFTASAQSLGSSSSLNVAFGDVDGDGDLDAFVANSGGQGNRVWRNDGTGMFQDSGQSLGFADSAVVALGDLDGDGDLDAFVANASDQPDEVWINDGSGTFHDSGQSLGSSPSYGLALGDLDGDGDLDAFVANAGQANRVWLNETGIFSDSGQSLGSAFSFAVALGDVDGDGDLDAFVANNVASKVWLNDATGAFHDSGQSLGDGLNLSIALGDLDADGDLDAFVGRGGPNEVWLNRQGADLGIVKTAVPTTASPGELVTYRLVFANHGLEMATGVVITDRFPVSVTHSSLSVSNSGAVIIATGSISYVWEVADLAPGEGGIITVTGVLSHPLSAGTFTNTAEIATTALDGRTSNNRSDASIAVEIGVPNQAPYAHAGPDQTVALSATVTLDGGESDDPDGHTPLSYGWTQTGGPTVTLSDRTAVSTTFDAPGTPTFLSFALVVTDSLGLASAPDTVVVSVGVRRIFLPLVLRGG